MSQGDSWLIILGSAVAVVLVYWMINAAIGTGQGVVRAWRADRRWRGLTYQRARAEVNWAIERITESEPSRYWLDDDEEWELHDTIFHLRQVRASR